MNSRKSTPPTGQPSPVYFGALFGSFTSFLSLLAKLFAAKLCHSLAKLYAAARFVFISRWLTCMPQQSVRVGRVEPFSLLSQRDRKSVV